MKNNPMAKRVLGLGATLLSVACWILLWALLAHLLDIEVFFPGPIKTVKALLNLVITIDFWKTVALSMLRIILGLILGVAIGALLAFACRLLPFVTRFVTIGMTVVKSTPVASIVLILWVIVAQGIGSANLPIIIALLMVAPIIWQNLMDGFDSIDPQLVEVATVFEFPFAKRLRLIVLPSLLKFFIPAIITSIGLSWKSGIAAEIIAYTKSSIGRHILDAKSTFDGDVMLAWTIVVVLLSLLFEFIAKMLLRRYMSNAKTH